MSNLSLHVGRSWSFNDCVLQPQCLGFGALALELADNASEIADDDTTSAEGPAE